MRSTASDLAQTTRPSTRQWAEISRLFHQLSRLNDDTRRRRLRTMGRDDPALAAELEELLLADADAPDRFGESGSAGSAPAAGPDSPIDEASTDGKSFEQRYQLLRELGRGGMGVVYLARRADDAYEQRVAIKLIRRGLGSAAIIRRFRSERQILAGLSHPNIARLLDGGSTADGRPYLAMEYIDGEPITRYCDRHRLPVRRRLALFLEVCAAVQYAHQRWIVHRDLKASNILVTPEGVPMLLDFGTAKLIEGAPTGLSTSVTHTADRWLTLASASPEQIRGELVTAASDVYGLGTLLYELLTGTSPHRFDSQAPDEILRVLCQVEPEPPSRRVRPRSGSPESLGEPVADVRGTSVLGLYRTLRGDLDAIVVKALQKDPSDRYSTVDHLADDLRRTLDNRPIRARRLTPLYLAGKTIRRHRRFLVAGGMVAALMLDLVLWSVQESRNAAQQREVAEAQRAKAEQVSQFLVEMFDGAAPDGATEDTPNVRQLLDRGIATVRRRFAGHPEVQATLLTAIGAIHRKMGDYDLAGALIEGALAEFRAPQDTNDPTLASIRHEQGLLQMERGRFAAAGVHFEEALRIRRKALGEHHPETLQSQVELAEINRLLANFGAARQLAGDALDTLAETGRRQHALFARCLTVLGWLDLQGRRVDLATSRLEEALRVQERYHGQDHAAAATTTVTLAMAHHAAGESERATTLLRRALTIYENRLGTEHLYVAIALMNLARIEIDAARFDEAKAALDRAGRILQASAGPDSVLFALWISDIARIQLHRDEVEAAEEKLQAAHAILVEALPPDHPLALETLNLLGDAARRRGGLQRADERFAETMDSQLGSHPETPL